MLAMYTGWSGSVNRYVKTINAKFLAKIAELVRTLRIVQILFTLEEA